MTNSQFSDEFTERHFQQWLDSTVYDDERSQVEQSIRVLVSEYPDLLERLSWPEMRDLTERNERLGIK